jgi:hypothetical protein
VRLRRWSRRCCSPVGSGRAVAGLVAAASLGACQPAAPAQSATPGPCTCPSASPPTSVGAGTVHPGEQIFAAEASVLTELQLNGARWRLSAQRWNARDPFMLVVSAPGLPPRSCVAGPGFERALGSLISLEVKRVLAEPEAQQLQSADSARFLRLFIASDSPAIDPVEYRLFVPDAADAPVVAFVPDLGGAVELTLPAQLFVTLGGGCDSLGPGSH